MHKISFTTQNITNTETGFNCLSLTFVLQKTEYEPTFSVMLDWKCEIKNNQSLVRKHICFYSQSEITNQAHSKPSFNVLATRGLQLGMEIQKPNKNWNYQITSSQDILHNVKHNKHKNGFSLSLSDLCFNIYLWIPNWQEKQVK